MSKPKVKVLKEEYVEPAIYKQLVEINGKTETRFHIKVYRHTPRGKTKRPGKKDFAKNLAQARIIKRELEVFLDRAIADSQRHTVSSYYKAQYRGELEESNNKCSFYNVDSAFNGRILPFLGSKFLEEVSPADVNDFIHVHLGDIAVTTKRNYRKYLSGLMKSAVVRRIIRDNPVDLMRKIKGSTTRKETFLSPQQLSTLFDFLFENKHEWRYHIALITLTGMRINECRALTYADIRWDLDLIHVCRTFDNKNGFKEYTKNYKHRFVPLNSVLKSLLWERKEKEKLIDQDFVLPQHRKWVSGEHSKVINDLNAFLGLPEMDYYDYRATFTVAMALAGANAFTISEVLGHKSLETIVHYLRKLGMNVKGETQRLNSLIDPKYLPPLQKIEYRIGELPAEGSTADENDDDEDL